MENLTSSLKTLSARGGTGREMESAKDTSTAADLGSSSTAPSLEGLPVELQSIILSKAATLQSLSALVHASPDLHRVYTGNRLQILRSVLSNSLAGMVVDAQGAYQSGTDVFQGTREESMLWAFIRKHESNYTTAEGDWIAQLSSEDVIQLLHFHIFVIEPLTERYASWALASLPTSSEEEPAGQSPLSDTERRRIQRAMYHLQLFCNVFGSRGAGHSRPDRIYSDVDRLRVLSIFPPWEIEQIICVNEFAIDTFSDIFRRVAWDLNMDKNPKYRHLCKTATIDDLMLVSGKNDEYVNERSLNTALSHGLELLLDTIKTEDHERLVDRIRAAILSNMGDVRGFSLSDDWIDCAVGFFVQEDRREKWYSQHDLAQDFKHKMPFNGDRLDSPPLAWVLFWRGEYSNLIGPYINPELRRWGYAFWDAPRLGSRPLARIDYWSFELCGRGDDEDPRGDTYDPSVRVEDIWS